VGTEGYFPGAKGGEGLKLITHRHLVKNGGAIPPLPMSLHGAMLNYLSTRTMLPFIINFLSTSKADIFIKMARK
jgi:hypothetical protein